MSGAYAKIHIPTIADNIERIRQRVGLKKIMAMVKADAYGHGSAEMVKGLRKLEREPDYYGVAFLSEALKIQDETEGRILLTEPLNKSELDIFLKKARDGVMPTLMDIERARSLSEGASGKPVRVHIKINTGLNRLGVRAEGAVELIRFVLSSSALVLDGVYTHFADSPSDTPFTRLQLERFENIISQFKRTELGLLHTANSGAIINLPLSFEQYDMVRPGILLYGYYPSRSIQQPIEVTPALSLSSYVSSSYPILAGESVGYGRTYTAEKDHYVASIAMGYADGIPTALSGKLDVLVDGRRYRQVGRISMDRFSVNSEARRLAPGIEVLLIGGRGGETVTLTDWSKASGISVYELLCGLKGRFERVYT